MRAETKKLEKFKTKMRGLLLNVRRQLRTLIGLELRPANSKKAAILIDKICPDASPTDIMTTWRDAVLRKGQNEAIALGRALRMSPTGGQGDWWFNRYGRTPHYATMAETIAAHLLHFQTAEQIAQAEQQLKDRNQASVARFIYFEIQKVPAGIRPKVLQGVLEELDQLSKTGQRDASGN